MLRIMIKLTLVLLFFSISVHSQTLTGYGFKLGAVASNPIWKVGSQTYDGVETRIGMDAGLFLNWSLANKLSLLTEMHYIQKELRYYEPVISSDQTGVYAASVTSKTDYLSIPIFLKYDLLTSEVTPYLLGGLRVDFMLSKSENNGLRWLYSNVNRVDFGGSIGLGFQTKSLLGIGTGLEIKYSPSFVKVDSSPAAEITNRSFEINFILYK